MLSSEIIFINGILTFLIGCCFGSFLNVVIYRLPLGRSIISPGSYCIECKTKIRWFENIPLLSWFFLRGKCSNCKSKISIIYPIVEFTSGILFLLNNYSSPSTFNNNSSLILSVLGWVFISILLTLAILDIKYFWLPDSICKFGILFGIFSSLIIEIIYHPSNDIMLPLEAIIAAFIGYLIFQLISAIGLKIYKKPVMGKGDSKLSALIGSWLGIKGLLITICLAFNLAGIFVIAGLILKKLNRKQKIPFGSFLALSGMCVWYFGDTTFTKLIYLAA